METCRRLPSLWSTSDLQRARATLQQPPINIILTDQTGLFVSKAISHMLPTEYPLYFFMFFYFTQCAMNHLQVNEAKKSIFTFKE